MADPIIPATPANNLYSRQASLNLSNPQVTLVGCGGVGVWVALALVLGGVEELTLYDGDTLSEHNLNRFPLPLSEIGRPKSLALADWLYSLRSGSDISIEARGELIPKVNGIWPNPPNPGRYNIQTYVVCATDSLKSRLVAWDLAKDINAKYLEVGADGERWTLSPNPPEFSTDLEEQPGYATVPVHVGPCMMAGAAAAYYVLHNTKPHVSHSGEWKPFPAHLSLRTIEEEVGAMGLQPLEFSDEGILEDEEAEADIEAVLHTDNTNLVFDPGAPNGTTGITERIDNEQEARTQVEE